MARSSKITGKTSPSRVPPPPRPDETDDSDESETLARFPSIPPPTKRDVNAGVPPSEPPPEDEFTQTSQTAIKIAPTGEAKAPMLTQLTGLTAGEVRMIQEREIVIGRAPECKIRLLDQGISRKHAKLVGVVGGPYMIEDLKSTNGTFVDGKRVMKMKLRGGERIQLGPDVVFRFAFGDETEEALARKLYEASTRDPLTRCHSRRFLEERLQAELAYARRHSSQLGVIMFDIDHFKSINDTLGHPAGDSVLRDLAACVTKLIRVEDVLGRYGGEEFAVVVRGIKHKKVVLFAERLRKAVEALRVPVGPRLVEVTISLGVGSLDECAKDAGVDALVALADTRLYKAKRGGRNRTCGA